MRYPTKPVSIGALLAAMLCGCSGDPEPSSLSALALQQSAEEQSVSRDQQFRTDFSDYELPERTLNCPSEEHEFQIPTASLFYPAVIDAEIARFPELRDAVGSDAVETCEQARRWSDARLSIVEGEIPSSELPLPEADSDTPPLIDKIWNGLNHSDDSQPGFWITGGTPYQYCSAVAITPNHLLTAAHCVPANTIMCSAPGLTSRPCSPFTIDVYQGTASGGKNLYGSGFVAYSYKFEGFGGGVDPANDLALIEMPGGWEMWQSALRPIELYIPNYDYYVAGWGRNCATCSNSTAGHGVLRRPPGNAWFHADMMADTYMYDRGDSDVHMCNGDSGGPAVASNDGSVGGIHTSSEKASSSHKCSTDSEHKKRWTRPGHKILWIEARLRLSPFYSCPVNTALACCTRTVNTAQCY